MNPWLEKQRHLIDFTLASLGRRKTKNIGLLLAYTLLVFVLASLTLFTHALRSEAAFVLAGSPEVILQRMVAGRHDLIPPITSTRSVVSVESRRRKDVSGVITTTRCSIPIHLHGAAGR